MNPESLTAAQITVLYDVLCDAMDDQNHGEGYGTETDEYEALSGLFSLVVREGRRRGSSPDMKRKKATRKSR